VGSMHRAWIPRCFGSLQGSFGQCLTIISGLTHRKVGTVNIAALRSKLPNGPANLILSRPNPTAEGSACLYRCRHPD
jgi:hypothetical protein